MLLLSLLTHVLLGFAELCRCATGLSSRLYGQTEQARHPTDTSNIVSHFLLVCFLFEAAHVMPHVPVGWLSLWSVGFGCALRLCMPFFFAISNKLWYVAGNPSPAVPLLWTMSSDVRCAICNDIDALHPACK